MIDLQLRTRPLTATSSATSPAASASPRSRPSPRSNTAASTSAHRAAARIPGVAETESGKIELAPSLIIADLAQLTDPVPAAVHADRAYATCDRQQLDAQPARAGQGPGAARC